MFAHFCFLEAGPDRTNTFFSHDLELPELAKIGMTRLNNFLGILRLNSCMLRLSLTSSVQGGCGGRGLLGLMR